MNKTRANFNYDVMDLSSVKVPSLVFSKRLLFELHEKGQV